MWRGVGSGDLCIFFAVWLHQRWHTSVLVFVVYGELLAACFGRAGLHCVETFQLLLLLLLPSLSPPLPIFSSPSPPLHLHVKRTAKHAWHCWANIWTSLLHLTLSQLTNFIYLFIKKKKNHFALDAALKPTLPVILSSGKKKKKKKQISADAVMSGNVKGSLIAP